jgi:anti-sigma regulatory factor (Ser/Thr protein kinase)
VLSEVATLLVVLAVSVSIRKKENAKGLLLLQKTERIFADLSIPATIEASVDLSQKMVTFCRENGIDESTSVRIGVAIEEMAVNTAKYSHKNNKGEIDILVKLMQDEMILRLRDNGVPFNPTHHKSNEEKYAVGGIEVVRRLAKEIKYTRQLGFNVTIITIPRKELIMGGEI